MSPRLLAALLVFFATVYLVRIRDDMVDFEVNYRAGARLLAGESLYRTEDGHFMFKYFPFSAMLYVPLATLPLEAAKAIWYAITASCTVGLFVLSKRIVSGREPRPWWVLALPPVVLAKFCLRELKLGQINTLVTLVLLFMVIGLLHERRDLGARFAGAAWGLATALKPYGFIFLPYFVVTRAWKSLLSGLAVLLLAGLAPSIFYGLRENLDAHRDWFVTLSQSTPAQLSVNDNISIVGFFAKWLEDPVLARNLALLLVAGLAGTVLFVVRRGRDMPRPAVLECALLLTLIPLVSPLGWDYQLLTSVLGLTLIAHHWGSLEIGHRWFLGLNLSLAAFAIYDVIGRRAYGLFMSWSVLTLNFLVVVAYLVYLRRRELC